MLFITYCPSFTCSLYVVKIDNETTMELVGYMKNSLDPSAFPLMEWLQTEDVRTFTVYLLVVSICFTNTSILVVRIMSLLQRLHLPSKSVKKFRRYIVALGLLVSQLTMQPLKLLKALLTVSYERDNMYFLFMKTLTVLILLQEILLQLIQYKKSWHS